MKNIGTRLDITIKVFYNLNLVQIEQLFVLTLFHKQSDIAKLINYSGTYIKKIQTLKDYNCNDLLWKYWQFKEHQNFDLPTREQIKKDSLDFYNWIQQEKIKFNK